MLFITLLTAVTIYCRLHNRPEQFIHTDQHTRNSLTKQTCINNAWSHTDKNIITAFIKVRYRLQLCENLQILPLKSTKNYRLPSGL